MRRTLLALLWACTAACASSPLRAEPPPPARPVPATEQAWVIRDVLSDIASLTSPPGAALPAITVTPASHSFLSFTVTVGSGAPATFTLVNHLWSPDAYAAFARQRLQGQSPDPAAGLNTRTSLVGLNLQVLLDEDERVGAALAAHPRSAAAHESAALVLGAFALRESEGLFADSRRELSRMAAHLAIAQVLRGDGPDTRDGRLALGVLTLLVGHQRVALDTIDTLAAPGAAPADRAWVRALRLRITGDWREELDAAKATRLERLEYARALRLRAGAGAMLDWLETMAPDEGVEWFRIANTRSRTTTVENVHRFSEGVAPELDEVRTVWARVHGGTLDESALVTALNGGRPSASAATPRPPRVIDWTRWAAALQRGVADAIVAEDRGLWMLGLPDDRLALVEATMKQFSRLTLYPVLLRAIARTPEQYAQSMRGLQTLLAEQPDQITFAAWNVIVSEPPAQAARLAFPEQRRFFLPYVPAGTGFDLYERVLYDGCPRPPSVEQATLWAEQMPYDLWVQWGAAWFPVEGKPASLDVRRRFGVLLSYDALASELMYLDLDLSSPEQVEVTGWTCAIAPDRCDHQAWALVVDNRVTDAVQAYEDWIATSRDRVRVSKRVSWLVRHYAATGRLADADRVATLAAETGSGAGYSLLGWVREVQGRFDEAEQILRRNAERYDDRVPLGIFRLRRALAAGDTAAEVRAFELLDTYIPGGLQRLALQALDPAPLDGVLVTNVTRRARGIGLRPDDIIVGVDDWRVRSYAQYDVAIDLRRDEAVRLTVYRAGRYQQLDLRVPERRFGTGLETYVRKRP